MCRLSSGPAAPSCSLHERLAEAESYFQTPHSDCAKVTARKRTVGRDRNEVDRVGEERKSHMYPGGLRLSLDPPYVLKSMLCPYWVTLHPGYGFWDGFSRCGFSLK